MPVLFRQRGIPEAIKELRVLQSRLRDPRPGFVRVANSLEKHVQKQFATSGREGTKRGWRRLRPSTLEARRRRWGYYRRTGRGTRPLIWTGRMRRSFKRGGTGHVRRITKKGLVWGSSHPFASFHQDGTRPIIAFRSRRQELQVTFEPLRRWLERGRR